jgi:glycosyltransferase involved in cell wall biosynthesis
VSLTERIEHASRECAGAVVILSANPMRDTGGGQRGAQLALELLERAWCVVFVAHGEVTETVDLGLRFDHPRLVEMPLATARSREGRRALRAIAAAPRRLIVTQVPVAAWLRTLIELKELGATAVYDLIDRWDSELGRGWYRPRAERRIAAASDVLAASAPSLARDLEARTGRPVHLLPNAFNARVFDPDASYPRPPLLPEGGRVALYVGALWGGWMDWGLVRRLASELPDTTLVFVGDHRGEGAELPARCVFTGLEPQAALPAWLAHADVAFLPWEVGPVTQATSPLKVYEFLAVGLPVVAPDLEPLRGLPGVRLARGADALVRAVAETDRATLAPEVREAMRTHAAKSSWAVRLDRLLTLVAEQGAGGVSAASSAPRGRG